MLQVVPYEEEVAGQRMQVVEDHLSKAHYLLGEDFTAVDIVCGQVLTLAEVSCNVLPSCTACMPTTTSVITVSKEMLTACRCHAQQSQAILISGQDLQILSCL